jgi:hypothetical protein
MINDFGRSSVTIKKAELLAVMKKNRDSHRDIFLKAQEGYRKMVIQELDGMLSDARQGFEIRRSVELEEPVDKTKDYDRVIKMMEMSTADEISISETQFSQYVLDEWGWSHQFTTTNSKYSK